MTSFFRDEKGNSERLSYYLKSHSQSGQSWGSTPGLLAPPLPCTLCPPRPRSLWNLLLLLWTFLNCGLGGNAQVKGDIGPGAAGMGTWLRHGVSQPPLQADCDSLSPSRVRVSGRHGVPGVAVPALAGEGSQCAAGDVSGEEAAQ